MTCYNSENFKNYYPPTRFKGIPIAFDTKRIPANLGDSVSYPPKLGMYTNTIVKYEADDTVWLYDSFSNYTQIDSGGSSSVVSVNGKTGAVVLKTSDLENDSGYVTDPQLAQDAATKNYVDSFYPVGSVYSSTSSTAPTFAGGTWTNIGSQTIGSSTVYYYERTA